ncbi:YidC/Oxa1 family membrane protein insertase [Butyrivibrio proteoclasticus]|uniref:YidC/Oxa1 family membrane protein insertase n=1 Tax=Butyrivibrio proteoclasticus TaxID=43305 RepID=UPI00047AE286|nr:YidC/Oxa1 family membrane protein insertase [Butyrivibrio proteoclasticus]
MSGVVLTQYQSKFKLFTLIAKLLGYLMEGIFNVLNAIGIPNIGLAIIIFTLVIYLCLLPLTYKQQKFSKLQSKMSPELKAIQAKYKGKKDQDSMLAQNQEIKELYAKYGVSQTGSCIQLLIQMPILFSLYRVIYSIPAYVGTVKNAFYPLVEQLRETAGATDFIQNSISSAKSYSGQFNNALFTAGDQTYVENTFIDVLNKANTADWDALTSQFPDLSTFIASTHEKLNTYNFFLGLNIANSPKYMITTAFADKNFLLLIGGIAVPFLAAFTQWINTKLMPQPNNGEKPDPDDPTAQMAQSMKTMNIMMPIMSAIFCLQLPAGMGLYWIAGAVIRSIQQILINKHIDKIDIDSEIAKNSEKYQKKMEKMKSSKSLNVYANMSTKNISNIAKSSELSEEEIEEKLQHSRDVYLNNEIRKDSLLAKANMVRDYNEYNDKQ